MDLPAGGFDQPPGALRKVDRNRCLRREVKIIERPASAASRNISNQNCSRRLMKCSLPNGKTDTTVSTTRWLWNTAKPVSTANSLAIVSLPAATGP